VGQRQPRHGGRTGIGMRSGAPGTPVVSGCGILEAAAFGDTSAAIGDINLRRASDQTTEESAGHPRRAYSRALAARPVSRLTGCLRPSYDSTEPSVWLPFASPLPLPAALYPARPQRAVSSDRRHLRGQWGGGGGVEPPAPAAAPGPALAAAGAAPAPLPPSGVCVCRHIPADHSESRAPKLDRRAWRTKRL
jgi:hypothetical protein